MACRCSSDPLCKRLACPVSPTEAPLPPPGAHALCKLDYGYGLYGSQQLFSPTAYEATNSLRKMSCALHVVQRAGGRHHQQKFVNERVERSGERFVIYKMFAQT